MTDKQTPTPTPTDAELKAMWQLHAADIGGIFHYARAVLAKWGTPAPVGVGEVAEHYRNAIASACEGWTMPDGLRKHLETALWSLPTQAQAGEVPLTEGQIQAMCKESWLFETVKQWVRITEQYYGIKGGQHGTE